MITVARGGEATVEGIRLRCRAHHQLEAERVFGAGFMQEKRDEARRRVEAARPRKAEPPEPKVRFALSRLGERLGRRVIATAAGPA